MNDKIKSIRINRTADGKINIRTIAAVLAAILVVGICVYFLIKAMTSSVNSAVYAERKGLLSRLTESCADIIDDSIVKGDNLAGILEDSVSHELCEYASVEEFIDDVSKRPDYIGVPFFLVDDAGKYYSSDGVFGKIKDTEYYASNTEDELKYLSTLPHLDSDHTYLIFRNRLKEPVTIAVREGECNISYSGILFELTGLNESISKEFAGENNTFIYDNNGVMLYKEFGIRLLIDGYNIYPKFEESERPFGEKSDDLIAKCKNKEIFVVELTIDDEGFYFCTAPLEYNDWSVAFVAKKDEMSAVSGNSFGSVVLYISLILLLLGAAIIAVIIVGIRGKAYDEEIRRTNEVNVELNKATRAKTDFLSNMSHDIRTPINGIVGMTTIARQVEGNPARTLECLDKIDNASRHLLSLINDVLDMSRIEEGKTKIETESNDLRIVIDNCASIVRGQIVDRNLALETEISCKYPYVYCDGLHLRQILINILGNAVKFTPDGGSVILRCTDTDEEGEKTLCVIEVEDTGIGMSEEFIGHVFEAFSQDKSGARTNYKGTGLGMAITKHLTELMGGNIEVESKENVGTKFVVKIPFEIDREEKSKKAELVENAATDIAGVRILLAEDNELNREIAIELLEEAGAVITAAENGNEALHLFEKSEAGEFDVVLMDVMMPKMNGLDATRAIRSLERSDAKKIPIIAMTANAFETDVKASIEAGMNAHLTKPIDFIEVINVIAKCLSEGNS